VFVISVFHNCTLQIFYLKNDSHVSFVLRTCTQRLHLLKQLRDQGLSSKQLEIVFQSIIITRIAYTAPPWSGLFPKSKKAKFMRCGGVHMWSTQNLLTFKQTAQRVDHTLFNSIKYHTNCQNQLLSPRRNTLHILRDRGLSYILPSCTFQLYNISLINRCQFGNIVSSPD